MRSGREIVSRAAAVSKANSCPSVSITLSLCQSVRSPVGHKYRKTQQESRRSFPLLSVSVCASISRYDCLSTFQPVHSSVCSLVYLSVCLSLRLSDNRSINLSVRHRAVPWSAVLSLRQAVCLSVRPSVTNCVVTVPAPQNRNVLSRILLLQQMYLEREYG